MQSFPAATFCPPTSGSSWCDGPFGRRRPRIAGGHASDGASRGPPDRRKRHGSAFHVPLDGGHERQRTTPRKSHGLAGADRLRRPPGAAQRHLPVRALVRVGRSHHRPEHHAGLGLRLEVRSHDRSDAQRAGPRRIRRDDLHRYRVSPQDLGQPNGRTGHLSDDELRDASLRRLVPVRPGDAARADSRKERRRRGTRVGRFLRGGQPRLLHLDDQPHAGASAGRQVRLLRPPWRLPSRQLRPSRAQPVP